MMLRTCNALLERRHHYRLQAISCYIPADVQGMNKVISLGAVSNGSCRIGIGFSKQKSTLEFWNTVPVPFSKQSCETCWRMASHSTALNSMVKEVEVENDDEYPQALLKLSHMSVPQQCVGPLPRYQRSFCQSYKGKGCLPFLLYSRCRSFCSSPKGQDGAFPSEKSLVVYSQKLSKVDDSDDKKDDSDDKKDDSEPPFNIKIGDWDWLSQKIGSEKGFLYRKLQNYENRFNRLVKPKLLSSCLLAPHNLTHASTFFLHRQTFLISGLNPIYLSSFDIMAYEDGVKDEKVFDFFIKHIIDKRVYVILDWESSLSTIETLMYDHGVIEPKDESEHEFHKGEFDASYRDGTASLSFIIWRGDKIIYSEVYKGVKCYSATEAEAYAAFALLTKAAEMGIEKLQVCSDCMPVCKILSGELCIPRNHKHWNLYLMLRSLRRLFTKLVVTWKPRELMIFPDDLAKANVMAIGSPLFPKELLERWKHHLSGLVLFRIERTEEATKRIAKFGEVDESYAQNEASVFLVEVEEDLKPQCLQYLKKALKPKKLIVTFDTTVGRSEGFKMPPVDVVWSKKWEDLSG